MKQMWQTTARLSSPRGPGGSPFKLKHLRAAALSCFGVPLLQGFSPPASYLGGAATALQVARNAWAAFARRHSPAAPAAASRFSGLLRWPLSLPADPEAVLFRPRTLSFS